MLRPVKSNYSKSHNCNCSSIKIKKPPANDLLNIKHGLSGSLNIKVYTLGGQLVKRKVDADNTVRKIDISDYKTGTYFITISNGMHRISKTFIKNQSEFQCKSYNKK